MSTNSTSPRASKWTARAVSTAVVALLLAVTFASAQDPVGWGEPEVAMPSATGEVDVVHAVSPSGNATVLFNDYEPQANGYRLVARSYSPENGWGGTKALSQFSSAQVPEFDVAMDDAGNALAVWSTTHQAGNIRAIYYSAADQTWSGSEDIESNTMDQSNPKVVLNNAGTEGVVVWSGQDSNGDWHLWTNSFTPSDDWGTASDLAPISAETEPTLATSGARNHVAVWSDEDDDVWASHWEYVQFSVNVYEWSTPEVIDDETSGPSSVTVAMAPDGTAIAAWRQLSQSQLALFANRYDGEWGGSEAVITYLAQVGGPSYDHAVATDGSSGILVRTSASDSGSGQAQAFQWDATDGWSSATTISSGTSAARSPSIAMDGDGNALATWNQDDGTDIDASSAYYTPSDGWGSAETFDGLDAPVHTGPVVAMDGDGKGLAAWIQGDDVDSSTLYSSWFDPTATQESSGDTSSSGSGSGSGGGSGSGDSSDNTTQNDTGSDNDNTQSETGQDESDSDTGGGGGGLGAGWITVIVLGALLIGGGGAYVAIQRSSGGGGSDGTDPAGGGGSEGPSNDGGGGSDGSDGTDPAGGGGSEAGLPGDDDGPTPRS